MKWLEPDLHAVGAAVALAAGGLVPTLALGWAVEGHCLVAEEAQQQLSPAARAVIDRLHALTLAQSDWNSWLHSPVAETQQLIKRAQVDAAAAGPEVAA